MTLFFTMLPLYLFGNLHCIGMCGPLVMMIGRHRYRYYYFLGRLVSFSVAGLFAGALGSVLAIILKQHQIPAVASFAFGGGIFVMGGYLLLGRHYPGASWLAKKLAPFQKPLSGLMLKDSRWATFFFGFLTIALPCGQTIIVFSACALAGGTITGLFNGFAFALLTSPSLALALHAQTLFHKAKKHYNTVMGISAMVVGMLTICRGLAEIEVIPHWILNPEASPEYHLVMF